MSRTWGLTGLICISLASGCLLGNEDDDQCLEAPTGENDQAVPEPPSLRNPFTGQCESVNPNPIPPFCDPSCGPCPGAEEPQAPPPTWGLCFSQCNGLDEATCSETSGCRSAFIEICDGGDCTLVYEDCWATDQTGPQQGADCELLGAESCSVYDDCVAIHNAVCSNPADPTTCSLGNFTRCEPEDEPPPNDAGACWQPADCTVAPPDCPDGTIAGVDAGCYTGFCIPLNECESGPACADITTESICVARPDCTPTYVGEDCTCTPEGCDCATLTFSDCE